MDLKEMVDILHSKKFKEHMNKIFVQRVKHGNYSKVFKHKLIRALNRSIDVCPNDINIELLRDELKRNGVEFKPYTDVYSANLSSLWAFFCGGIFVIQYDDIINYENSDKSNEKSVEMSITSNDNIIRKMTKKIRRILKKMYDNLSKMTRKKSLSPHLNSKRLHLTVHPNSKRQLSKHSRMTFAPKTPSFNQLGSGREIVKNIGEAYIPTWYPLAQTLFTVKNDEELYGSSMPSNDPTTLVETLKFYMFTLGIKQLVSIQSCEIWDEQDKRFMNSDPMTLFYDNNPNNWNNLSYYYLLMGNIFLKIATCVYSIFHY